MRIGIVTFYRPFGGALQCFALQTILKKLGHEVFIIDRPYRKLPSRSIVSHKSVLYRVKNVVLSLKSRLRNFIFPDVYKEFYSTNFTFTSQIRTLEDLERINTDNTFDAIIVGSDQPWNPDCINTIGLYFYLDWVKKSIKKYAYAVSFGKDTFITSPYNISKISEILASYEAISVREDSGISILKQHFGLDAIQCLDPTLLLVDSDYKKLIVDRPLKGRSLCCFFLDKTDNKIKMAESLAALCNCSIIDNNISKPMSYIGRKIFRPRSISLWLRNICDAEYVITDSFHGTVFSILFHKKFISINNIKRGSARFQSLLNMLGLAYRLIDENDVDTKVIFEKLCTPIDYSYVDKILSESRKKSLGFLSNIK